MGKGHEGCFCYIVLLLLTGARVPSGHKITFANGLDSINLRNLPAATARELGQYFLHLVHLGWLVCCPLLLLFIRGSLALHGAEQLILCSTNQQPLSNKSTALMCCSCGSLKSWDWGRKKWDFKNPRERHAGSFQHPWKGALKVRQGSLSKDQ